MNKLITKKTPKALPPGKIKILNALESLLGDKEFEAITWTDIAETAKVNQGLISKYFRSKRNLLHYLLAEYIKNFLEEMKLSLMGVEGPENRLRKYIYFNTHIYIKQNIFAKMLVLEVRNSPGYFQSSAFEFAQEYERILTNILDEGVKEDIFRDDIPVKVMRRIIIGSTEHACLPMIIYGKEQDPLELAEQIFKLTYDGIKKR